jgi:hypothetical protein
MVWDRACGRTWFLPPDGGRMDMEKMREDGAYFFASGAAGLPAAGTGLASATPTWVAACAGT